MNVYQVEEYYVTLDENEIDLSRKDEISQYISEFGNAFEFEADYLVIEDFDSEYSGEAFCEELMEAFKP